jgi:hypothetical protein
MTPAATSPRTACSAWRLIPKDKHYLCVGLADLQDIISDYGGNTLRHGISIAPGLVWVNPLLRSPFSKCPCANRAIPQARPVHSCPVQHIISPKLQSVMRGGPLELDGCDNGAVIFGQGWTWPDSGEPSPLRSPIKLPQPTTTIPKLTVEGLDMDLSISSGATGIPSSQTSHSDSTPLTRGTPMSDLDTSGAGQVSSNTTSPSATGTYQDGMTPQSRSSFLGTPSTNQLSATGANKRALPAADPANNRESKRTRIMERAATLSILHRFRGQAHQPPQPQ